MLKIKEFISWDCEDGINRNQRTVELKELEKFGFAKSHGIYTKEYVREEICEELPYKTVAIEEFNREIAISPTRGSFMQFNTDIELDIIFDLIQAGLVEKVNE
jgi:hypothetical protein